MGRSAKAKGKINGGFKMDLEGKESNRLKHRETEGHIYGQGVLSGGGN